MWQDPDELKEHKPAERQSVDKKKSKHQEISVDLCILQAWDVKSAYSAMTSRLRKSWFVNISALK